MDLGAQPVDIWPAPRPVAIAALLDRPQIFLTEKIASGGMSTVYGGFDTVTTANIAVKVIALDQQQPDSSHVEWARQEAIVMALLAKADHIAHFLEAGVATLEENGSSRSVRYLATMRYDNTLEDVAKSPRVSERQRIELFVGACRGVEAAHRHDVIHCDLKPANFLISRGQVALHDFGVAFIKGDPNYQPRSQEGYVFGTFETLSPEQLRGTHDFDHRVDIFGLGASLHMVLTNRSPHARLRDAAGEPDMETRHSPAVIAPELPAGLRAILTKALHYDPADRYQTATEFREDLERYQRGERVHAANELMGLDRLRYETTTFVKNTWSAAAKYAGAFLLGAATLFAAQKVSFNENGERNSGGESVPSAPVAPKPKDSDEVQKDVRPAADGKLPSRP